MDVTGPGRQEDSPGHASLLLTREVIDQTLEIEIDSPIMIDFVPHHGTTTPDLSRLCHEIDSVTMHVTCVITGT